jgi:hypothetical protein
MRKTVKKFSALDLATVTFMVACCVHPITAGTKGAYMNSAGYGKAVDSIVYGGVTNTASSVAMYYPCAAVNPQSNFSCNAGYTRALPPGTPPTVFCQSRGAPNYLWSIQSYVTGGAVADNPELEDRVNVVPATCASYEMESTVLFTDAYSGSITVSASASPGAALWLRGFEYFGAGDPANPGTPLDLADLLAHSTLKWDMLMTGPFESRSSATGCTILTIPFTTETGHANLYLVADGVAKSLPFSITCPGDFTVPGADPVVYPPAQVTGGCGVVTVTYDPPADQLPAWTTTVTATATDQGGNSASCTFAVTRQPTFIGFDAPVSGTGGTCDAPLRTFNRRSKIPLTFTLDCGGSPVTTGKPTVSIQQCAGGNYTGSGDFQLVGNDWVYEWDTRGASNTSALREGVYCLIATLPDGRQHEVFLQLVEPTVSPQGSPKRAAAPSHTY